MQDPKIGVLRGRNFRFKLSGPYSGWGNAIAADHLPVDTTLYPWVDTAMVQDQTVLLTSIGIFVWDGCAWHNVCPNVPMIWENCEDNDYPWTKAFVGSAWYFSHPTFGIAYYSVDECKWGRCNYATCEIEGKGRAQFVNLVDKQHGPLIADPIYGITQSDNRLIILARDTVSWSRIDDGCDLVSDMHKGIGFQNLSVNHYGQPLGVMETPKGFNVYTSNGTTVFTKRGDEAVFRVDHLSFSLVPINPFALTQHDSKVNYFLAKTGLYATDGGYPTLFEPFVGKWLADEAMQNRLDLQSSHSIRLSYSGESNEMFLSINRASVHDKPYVYYHSLVFNFDYGKWASFDQPHRSIGPSNLVAHRTNIRSLGFIAEDNTVRHFDGSKVNGYMECGLDSFIQIGAISIAFETDNTQQLELQQFWIYSAPNTTLDHINAAAPLQIDGYEERYKQTVNHQTRAAATPDGYSVIDRQWEECYLMKDDYRRKNYSCIVKGAAFIIEIAANQSGQFYDVQGIDAMIWH